MDHREEALLPTLESFLDSLFHELFNDKNHDPDIVRLIHEHLGNENIHSQAGKRLAKSIIDLAKERSRGESR